MRRNLAFSYRVRPFASVPRLDTVKLNSELQASIESGSVDSLKKLFVITMRNLDSSKIDFPDKNQNISSSSSEDLLKSNENAELAGVDKLFNALIDASASGNNNPDDTLLCLEKEIKIMIRFYYRSNQIDAAKNLLVKFFLAKGELDMDTEDEEVVGKILERLIELKDADAVRLLLNKLEQKGSEKILNSVVC